MKNKHIITEEMDIVPYSERIDIGKAILITFNFMFASVIVLLMMLNYAEKQDKELYKLRYQECMREKK